ncbi:MAG: PAS domain S-box protein [Pseudomonadota bacterium]
MLDSQEALNEQLQQAYSTVQQREETLLEEGALQRAIFNSANFSSIATDAQGVIQIFNVGAERMLGYKAADVMNKITPADISDPLEVIARAATLSLELETSITPGFEALVFKASRGIEDIYELTYIRKDGSRLPAVVSVTALRDAAETIIGYLLIGTDNTARKQVEEEQKKLDQRLRDQQFYTRSLIESNIDALMTTDPAGIISDVNRQMEELTGCTRDELIGAPFKNYFTDPDRAEAGIKRVLRENKVTNYELTALARDGKQTNVSYNATTFYDRDRNLQGVFAAARDVTERKLLDRVLEENNVELEMAKSVAEKANLAKSDFLSSMSHELRTPLSAILGFAQLIESGSPIPSPMQKRSLDQILQAGWYLLDLINEILDLALIESGKLSLSMEPVSLAEVMQECATMIEPQAQKRGITVSFPHFDSSYLVHADHTRVKQVLINLLSNAIKYNSVGGTVVLTCEEHTTGRLRITVADNGEGLSSEQITQLFQPFNRLGQESKAEEGTGIGLVMTKRLIELMGGAIGLDSIVGKGSIFWIELNLTSEKAKIGASEPVYLQSEADIGISLSTLLYVEDNPANLMLVEDLIARRRDIRLFTARDGHSGVALAREMLPDLILMDINLPGISGIEALKLLSKDPTTSHIPVIALSANAIPRDIEKGLQAGFFRYLTKPIKVDEFMQTLDIALKFADATTVRSLRKNGA